MHVDNKHAGVKYSCDHCEFVANIRAYLNRHMRQKHPEFIDESSIAWTPRNLSRNCKEEENKDVLGDPGGRKPTKTTRKKTAKTKN